MRVVYIVTIVVLLMIVGSAFCGDLYLLKIDNQQDLEHASVLIDHAYGIIGERFIVDLNPYQVEQVNKQGLEIEFIASGFTRDKFYFAEKVHQKEVPVPIALSPVYSEQNKHIVELEVGSEQILHNEGFKTRMIGAWETPLFLTPSFGENLVILDNYPTDTLADYVVQDSIYNYDVRLQQFYTRFIGSDSIGPARDWLEDKFTEFGYTRNQISSNSFSTGDTWCGSYSGSSIICTKPGSVYPDRYILIGAHIDAIRSQSCSNPNYYAPGADDNGSGTSAVLEAARIFKDFDNKKTLMFVGLDGEELGLHGAHSLAQMLYEDSVNLDFMLNSDMIGFTDDTIPDAGVAHHECEPYLEIFCRSIVNVSELIPDILGGGSSDQEAFNEFGFRTIFLHEGDFNWGGWHTSRDTYSRMDFPYLKKIVQTLVTSVAVLDQMPDPLVFKVNDKGDGQSVRVSWEDSGPNTEYTLIWGPLPTFLDDTISVPMGATYYDLNNLAEEYSYYFSVYHTVEGFPQLTFSTTEASSQIIPRAPTDLTVSPDTVSVGLVWKTNSELDISYYQVFKQVDTEPWSLLADNWADTSFLDMDVASGHEYAYKLTAVDNDSYVSDTSDVATCLLVSFDAGILLVDETQTGGLNPTEGAQSGYYRQILGDFTYTSTRIDSSYDQLGHALMGQYAPLFWFDDDNTYHMWNLFTDTLQWYFDYDNDFMFAGWNSIFVHTGNTFFYPGYFLYDELGISYVGSNFLNRFVGASGEGDWPDLVVRSDAPNDGHLNDIQVFAPAEGGEVIYRFETDPYHEGFQDKAVGIAYDTFHGKRIVLGFPIYWLTVESAQALMTRALEYFAAESIRPFGDVNLDWAINILDVTYLINYLYKDGETPLEPNFGDPNGDCVINILDITYFISYLYKGGSVPLEGCVM